MRRQDLLMIALLLPLAGCGGAGIFQKAPEVVTPEVSEDAGLRPRPRPAGLANRPAEGANTAEALDTTSAAEREAAKVEPEEGEARALGETVASLGDPTEPGFWLKTPLVKTRRAGVVAYPEKGTTVQVELIPIDGEAGSGSRISLAALRLLEAPLTGLPKVEVFAAQ